MAIAGVTTGLTQSVAVGVKAETVWKYSVTVDSNDSGEGVAPTHLFKSSSEDATSPVAAINPYFVPVP